MNCIEETKGIEENTLTFSTISYLSLRLGDVTLNYQILPKHCIIFKGKEFEPLEFLELIKDIEV